MGISVVVALVLAATGVGVSKAAIVTPPSRIAAGRRVRVGGTGSPLLGYLPAYQPIPSSS
jgi:hypothetical protein